MLLPCTLARHRYDSRMTTNASVRYRGAAKRDITHILSIIAHRQDVSSRNTLVSSSKLCASCALVAHEKYSAGTRKVFNWVIQLGNTTENPTAAMIGVALTMANGLGYTSSTPRSTRRTSAEKRPKKLVCPKLRVCRTCKSFLVEAQRTLM